MSKVVDERIVEMRFDNRHFEQNVQTTMSTLDKLKQKLNLGGAAKGLEDINAAASKTNLSPLSKACETVSVKFSAMQIAGVTALANITNSAVNAGKRIISAFTIDPVKTGFQEYETQINAVQTILANTQSKGTTLDDVNMALDTLNTYADKTIYNFTEMTRNIGTFTAAGIDLDTSVNAIQGIANLAAVSGSTSQQASTAMYQLSQALASGTVKLMDWNSVVNAGMGGQVFQDALKETARVHGVAIDSMIEEQGSFRETLSDGWLTSEILTDTLQKFTLTTEGLTEEQIEQNREMLRAKGYTEDQIDAIFELGKTSTDAATKVKTFTQLFDTLKEAAQSGWTQTWELLVGDFEEAKELFTGLSNFFGDFINGMSEARNNVLGIALDNPLGKFFSELENPLEAFQKFGDKLASITGAAGDLTGVIDKVSGATEEYEGVVNRILKGEFGNGTERIAKLTEAGYDYAYAQNIVNEKLGSSVRHTSEFVEAQNGLTESQNELNKSQKDSHDIQVQSIEDLVKLNTEQLMSLGFTKEEILALRELEKQSEKTGIPLNELAEDIGQLNGRTLLLNGLKNIGKAVAQVFVEIGQAYKQIFDKTDEEKAASLYDGIAAFHKFSITFKNFVDSADEVGSTANKIQRTFAGLFAALDLIKTVVGGPLVWGIKLFGKVLGALGLSVLDVTAYIGDAIVGFRNWFTEESIFAKATDKLATSLANGIVKVKGWINAFKALPQVQAIIEKLKEGFEELKETGKGMFEQFKSVGSDIIAGLTNGVSEGLTSVPAILKQIGTNILNVICDVLGIESPSTEMYAIGEFTIAGLVNGLKDGSVSITDAISGLGKKISTAFSRVIGKINLSKLFSGGLSIGIVALVKKLADGLSGFTAVQEGLGDTLSGTGEVLEKSAKPIAKTIKNFSKVIKNAAKVVKGFARIENAFAFKIFAEGIKSVAIAIAILAGSVVLLALAVPAERLWGVIGALGALAVVIGILAGALFVMSKFGDGGSIEFGKIGLLLLSMSAAILLMGATIKMIGSLNGGQAKQGIAGLAIIMGVMAGILWAFGTLVKPPAEQNIDKAGVMLLKMSAAMLLMAIVFKVIGKLTVPELHQGVAFMGVFLVFTALLAAISLIPQKSMDQLGNMLLKISAALLILVGVVALISGLDESKFGKVAIFMAGFLGFITLLQLISMIPGGDLKGVGAALLGISASMLILVGVIALVSGMDPKEFNKGLFAVGKLAALVLGLIYVVQLIGGDAPKIALTILSMSVAIGILAAISVLLGMISIENLSQGIAAVGMLSLMMAGMILATKNAKGNHKNITAMAIAIGVMAAAIAVLSFIDPESLFGATLAMSLMMGMFAIMEKSVRGAKKALGALIVMTIAIGVMAGCIYLIAKLPIANALASSASLSILMLSFAASLTVISKVGNVAPMALVAISVMAVVLGVLAVILYLLRDMNPGNTLGTAAALSLLILSLSGACAILAGVGIVGSAALVGIGILATLIVGLGTLLVALGALVKYVPEVEEFLDRGIPVLEKIGYALGSFFGNIVSGFVDAGIIDSMAKIADAVKSFAETVGDIDESSMNGAKAVAEMLLILTGASLLQGLSQFFGAKFDFSGLKQQLNDFGAAVVSFADTITSAGGIDESVVTSAVNAGQIVASLYEHIPKEGGLMKAIFGEASLTDFATDMKEFASGVVEFVNTISGVTIDENLVKTATHSGELVAALYDKIPKTGGLVNAIFGTASLTNFKTEMIAFGEGVAEFAKKIVGISIDSDTVSAAVSAGEAVAGLYEALNGVEGEESIFEKIGSLFVGDSLDMSGFKTIMTDFGEAVAGFATNMSGVDSEQLDNATTSVTELVNSFVSFDGTEGEHIKSFAEGLKELGECGIQNFADAFSGSGSVVATAINDMVSSFKNAGSDLMSNFGIGIQNGKVGVVNAFNSVTSELLSRFTNKHKDFKTSVTTLLNNIKTTIRTDKKNVVAAVDLVMTGALDAVNDKYQDFYDAGAYIVAGLAAGIDENTSGLEEAAAKMVSLITEIVELEAQIESPSKVFYRLGKFIPMGFANGITKFSSLVKNSAEVMADDAIVSAEEKLTGLNRIKAGNVAIKPVVTPVYDMSSMGSAKLNLGADISAYMSQPVDSISQIMARTQSSIDASNREVISAVNGLREDLSNIFSGDDQEIALYVDSKKLATSLAKPMNRQLNILSKKGAY